MGYSGSNSEASEDSSSLQLEEDCVKNESVAMKKLPSGGTLGQHPGLGPSSCIQNETLREERIAVRDNHNTLFPGNSTGIFEVVARGDNEALSDWLITDTTSVCAIDKEGNTALHHAVASACQEGNKDENFYQCIDLLMKCKGMKVNLPNKNGYTAIGLAVHYHHRMCVEFMLKHPSAHRLHLGLYPGETESTVREIIMQTYPDLQPHLKECINQSLDSSDSDKNLLAALQRDKDKVFLKNLSPTNPNPWYDEPYHSSLLEIACQMKNREEFVKILLDKGADPNIRNSATGMPLIHATARSGNLEVLKLLLEHKNIDASVTDNMNRTILHWLSSVSGKKPDDKKRLDSCFKLVLKSCGNIIDWKDDEGNTALYIAVKSKFQDRVLLLLKRGADIMLSILGTPILSSVSTSMLEAILVDCLECNDEPETSKEVKLTFNYELLNKIIPFMAECPHQRELLKHPVPLCFINMPYAYITNYILASIIIYLIHLFTLIYAHVKPDYVPLFVLIGMWVTAVCFDLYYYCFKHVKILRTFEFILSLPIIFYIVGLGFDVIKSSWIWFYVLVYSSLLTSIKLALMTGRLPLVAVRLEVLKGLRWTIMAYYSFVLIILGFFIYIEYKDKDGVLSELFYALLKIIYTFVFKKEQVNINFDNFPSTIPGIFHFFVLPASFILLKLMNGLAWFDTHKLRMEAKTISLVKQVRILIGCNIYSTFQEHFRSNEMKERILCVHPHRWGIQLSSLIYRFTNRPCFLDCIRIKKQPSNNPKSTEEKQAAM